MPQIAVYHQVCQALRASELGECVDKLYCCGQVTLLSSACHQHPIGSHLSDLLVLQHMSGKQCGLFYASSATSLGLSG